MAVSIVQSTASSGGSGGTSNSLAFSSPTTSGNTIVVGINTYGLDDVACSITSVGDGTNTFVPVVPSKATKVSSDFGMVTQFYYCTGITGKSTDTISIVLGTSGTPYSVISLWELSASQFDQATAATGVASLSVSAGSLTPAANGSVCCMLADMDGVPTGNWSPDASWTANFSGNAGNGQTYSASYVQSTAASLAFHVTAGASGGSPNDWAASGIVFIPVGSGVTVGTFSVSDPSVSRIPGIH